MGLIDFVKSAGEDLFERISGGPEDQAAAIEKAIADHGIQISNLSVGVQDDTASLAGTAQSQADRERTVLIAGNQKGIARVDDRLEVPTPEPEAQFYTVEKGDTLSKIAKQFYGDAMKYPVIFEANRPMLKDPDRIYPGQKLRIPPQ